MLVNRGQWPICYGATENDQVVIGSNDPIIAPLASSGPEVEWAHNVTCQLGLVSTLAISLLIVWNDNSTPNHAKHIPL